MLLSIYFAALLSVYMLSVWPNLCSTPYLFVPLFLSKSAWSNLSIVTIILPIKMTITMTTMATTMPEIMAPFFVTFLTIGSPFIFVITELLIFKALAFVGCVRLLIFEVLASGGCVGLIFKALAFV